MKPAALIVAPLLAVAFGGVALAQGWAIEESNDPYSQYIVRAAAMPLREGCYKRKSLIAAQSHRERSTGKVQASIVVRLDGMRVSGRILDAAVRDVGALPNIGGDSGNVWCPSWGSYCRMEHVETFDVTPAAIAAAHRENALDLRVRTTDGPQCDIQMRIPASVWTLLGFPPAIATN